MAFKAYLPDGRIVCSSCKSEVKEKDKRCEICLSLLEVEKEGMECPYCGKIVDRYALVCDYCGKVLREAKKESAEGAVLDEEFLLKLLDLGKKVEKEAPEDVEERTKAIEVIKAVAGVVDETPREKEAPQRVPEEERKVEKEQKAEAEDIDIPEDIRKEFTLILEKNIAEMNARIGELPDGQIKETLADFMKTIASVSQSKTQNKIEKEKALSEFLALVKANVECLSEVISQYLSLAKMQNAAEELSKATQSSGGKISKKDWLAAQKQVQAELFKVKKELDEETERRVKKATKKAEEEIEKLKSQIKELMEENERLKKGTMSPEEERELRTLLKTLDDLLGNLPDNIIEDFAKSDKFKLYEKILDKYKVGED